MTARDLFLALALVALLALALAICGGACGPSDLELFKRAAGL
jgi:predicted small lipoprotein YifL